MNVHVATKNAGKLRELRAIFAGSRIELQTYAGYADVAETGGSYVGNAIIKARALADQLRHDGVDGAVLADDSGLEVDVLGGRPGVLSARYAGASSTWPQRRAVLLSELRNVPESARGARFVCVIVLLVPGEEVLASIGTAEGYVVEAERGTTGFGYDPLFLYPPCGCTFAELSEEEKNAVSHRRRAADSLLTMLKDRA